MIYVNIYLNEDKMYIKKKNCVNESAKLLCL